jgi:hypothetical protein
MVKKQGKKNRSLFISSAFRILLKLLARPWSHALWSEICRFILTSHCSRLGALCKWQKGTSRPFPY